MTPLEESDPLSVPHVLHQTWKTADVPSAFADYRASWRRHHSDWEHRLWTDEDNRRLIADHYPWFLAQYDAYPHPIQRADVARYFILHRHGGLYVDLDFECLRNIEPLLAPERFTLGQEPDDHARAFQRERTLCNALMASPAGHPFLDAVLEALIPNAAVVPPWDHRYVLETTGPFLLTRILDGFSRAETVAVLPSRQVYPLTMQEADVLRGVPRRTTDGPWPDERALRDGLEARLAEAYAVHYHVGTWWRPAG